MAKQKTTKRTIKEPIEQKIKRLNELYVNNGNKEQIKKLYKEINYFYHGIK